MLVSCLAYSSTLKTGAICSSGTFVYRITRRCVPGGRLFLQVKLLQRTFLDCVLMEEQTLKNVVLIGVDVHDVVPLLFNSLTICRPSTLTSISAILEICPVSCPVMSVNASDVLLHCDWLQFIPMSVHCKVAVHEFLLKYVTREERQSHSVCVVANNPTSWWHGALSKFLAQSARNLCIAPGSPVSSNSLRVWIKSDRGGGGVRNSVDQFYGWLKNQKHNIQYTGCPSRKGQYYGRS
jgi:hypothetical protein